MVLWQQWPDHVLVKKEVLYINFKWNKLSASSPKVCQLALTFKAGFPTIRACSTLQQIAKLNPNEITSFCVSTKIPFGLNRTRNEIYFWRSLHQLIGNGKFGARLVSSCTVCWKLEVQINAYVDEIEIPFSCKICCTAADRPALMTLSFIHWKKVESSTHEKTNISRFNLGGTLNI